MPEVSVIIPVYNAEKYLRECVDSVLAQTLTDLEVILVDDGSTDGSGAICDEYAATDLRVRVIHQQNTGQGLARNAGLEIARGRWVMFPDSDDIIEPDTLEVLTRLAEEHGAQNARGQADRFSSPGRYSKTSFSGECRVLCGRELRQGALHFFSTFPGEEALTLRGSASMGIYDREFLNRHRVRFLSERKYACEDYIFNFQVAKHADCICQYQRVVYHYRVNQASTTRALRLDRLEKAVHCAEFLETEFSRCGYAPREASPYAMGYVLETLRGEYKRVMLSELPGREKMEWAERMRSLPYFDRMEREYPWRRMGRAHRLHYRLFMGRRFRTLARIIRLQAAVRRLKGRVD